MAAAGITNRGEYLRRMAITGYVVRVDYSDIRDLQGKYEVLRQTAERIKEKLANM